MLIEKYNPNSLSVSAIQSLIASGDMIMTMITVSIERVTGSELQGSNFFNRYVQKIFL